MLTWLWSWEHTWQDRGCSPADDGMQWQNRHLFVILINRNILHQAGNQWKYLTHGQFFIMRHWAMETYMGKNYFWKRGGSGCWNVWSCFTWRGHITSFVCKRKPVGIATGGTLWVSHHLDLTQTVWKVSGHFTAFFLSFCGNSRMQVACIHIDLRHIQWRREMPWIIFCYILFSHPVISLYIYEVSWLKWMLW